MQAQPAAWRRLLTADLAGWRMAGQGGFHTIADDTIESYGGPGLLWYAAATFDDFVVASLAPGPRQAARLRAYCLQTHHEGSAVQFRNLRVAPLVPPI